MDYQETKLKIKSCRDVLVGVIPSPEAQVQQITIALIYKFMDDMDKEAQAKHNAQPMFFAGEFAKYAWTKLLSPQLGNYDKLNLYAEAIEKMNQNEGIPQLFRDIFKGAFLPYRNPEVLGLFLKEINGFTYEHSENLGNAFEHLLSIMGSQGDAGQFRTPRHIIDFIVAAIDPKKGDNVCDPACGTAGFLISAYKHILRQHDGKDDPKNKEKPLTPDEKKQLMNHFVGYDISPDMVRLSKVNMYLHGFPNPTIYEYDTLSSEEKWDESFDVMLANPPFMTPKGGIKPHKRFSVQANRSEVLFVDYILEHLRPNGRAGIIVPEGIIFQSGNAYKQLRKMLVEDGLFSIVSLPAGVFQPYAGVKTGTLLFDKALARKTQNILFIKIENDGYGLGAQRRPIDKNNLPQALEIIEKYKITLKNDKPFELSEDDKKLAHLVVKEKIAKTGDYNLSGDRYKKTANFTNQKWPMVELGNDKYFTIESGGTPDSKNPEYWEGNIRWATLVDLPVSNQITEITNTKRKITEFGLKNSSAKLLPKNSILVSSRATIGRIAINSVELATNQGFKNIVIKNPNLVEPKFVAYMMTRLVDQMISMASGGTFKEISKSNFSKLQIPLLPLEVQKEILDQIEVLEEERRFLDKEGVAITKRQTQVLESVISSQKQEIMDSKIEGNFVSSFNQVNDLIEQVLERAEYQHLIIESIILHLRELSYFFEKFFYDQLEGEEKKLLVDIARARNAICHRSSYSNNFNDHLIIQGGLNFKNGDIEIQYGRIRILFKKIVELYRKFREVVAKDARTNWMKQNPVWEIDQKRFDNLFNTYETKVKTIQEKVISKTKYKILKVRV